MINWICGFISGCAITHLLYSLLVEKSIQEEHDKVCKCLFEYEEYRRRIRTLEYQKRELEEKLKSSDYSDFYEVK